MPGRMKMSTFGLFFFFSNSFTRLFHEISVELLLFSIFLGNYLYIPISIPRNKYIPTAAQASSDANNCCQYLYFVYQPSSKLLRYKSHRLLFSVECLIMFIFLL